MPFSSRNLGCFFLIVIFWSPLKTAFADPAAGAPDAEAHPLSFCYESREVFPYVLGVGLPDEVKRPGVVLEKLALLDAALPEFSFRYQRASWKRCLRLLQVGEVDALVAGYTRSRETYAVYPTREGRLDFDRAFNPSSAYCLFIHRDSSIRWTDGVLENPDKQMLTYPSGYSVKELLADQRPPLMEVKSVQQGLELVQLQRVGGTIALCDEAESVMRTNAFPEINQPGITLYDNASFLIFSQQFHAEHKVEAERLWATLRTVVRDHHDAILQKYLSY